MTERCLAGRGLRALALASACLLAARRGSAQETGTEVYRGGAVRVRVSGFVQAQLETTSADSADDVSANVRRVRTELSVNIGSVVSGRIQPEFSPGNGVDLKDAWVRLTLNPAFAVTAGQAYRPFSLLTTTSLPRILPIERGVRIPGVEGAFDEYNLVSEPGYSERDVGVQVSGAPRGAPLRLGYRAGISRGPARDSARGRDTYQLAARVTASPVKDLRVAAGWSRVDFVRPAGETVDLRRGTAWEGDVEYGAYDRPGLHLLAEAAYGDFQPFDGVRFFGAQGWLAYRTPRLGRLVHGLEPVMRVSWGDANANDRPAPNPGGTLVTPGVNLYLGGISRVMVDWDFWSPVEGRGQDSFKAQLQVGL
jgi:hypothetical protein